MEIITEDNTTGSIVTDFTALFPPLVSFVRGRRNTDNGKDRLNIFRDIVTKRFVFDGPDVAALREKIKRGMGGLEWPTRVEALSALIWGALIAIAQEKHLSATSHVALHSVNLRSRMNPPLPENCIGSVVQVTSAEWPKNLTVEFIGSLAAKLRESMRMIDHEYVRKMHKNFGYLEYFEGITKRFGQDSGKSMYTFSSWCRFPFYEVDFGWGKPVWFSTCTSLPECAILIDTKDGEGIEAVVALNKDEMAKFERNSCILEYASFSLSGSL